MNKFPSFNDLLPYVGGKFDCTLVVDEASGVEDSIALQKGEHAVLLVDKYEDCVEWTVWLLRMQTGLSSETYIFDSEEVARKQLYLHVLENWQREHPEYEMPSDPDLAVEEYFESNEAESYVLTPQPVLCEPEGGYTTGDAG